jgi:hypothetical protein
MRTRVPEYDEVPPNAPSLVNSMCASGYDLESAVADIIDNSISARAASVRIIVHEEGESSWIAIADDGWVMDEATLRTAMTFGCIDPEAPRDPDDLGRFGLGLKTASLSQCRRFTVLTRRSGGKILVRCCVKNVIRKEGKWAFLRKGLNPFLEDMFRKLLQSQASGTVVLWEVLDRLGHDSRDTDIAERLQREVTRLDEHLSMVFHRFLARLGVELSARGDRLHYQAPKGVLTPEIKAALVTHKPALLANLAGPPEAAPEPEPPYWFAPNLSADDVDAIQAIRAWPLNVRTSWAEQIEAGRKHNEVVLNPLERRSRR